MRGHHGCTVHTHHGGHYRMSVPTEHPQVIEQIERLVDAGFEAAVSWLTMMQAWLKISLTAPYGYSAASEAANLLARAAQGQHASES